MKTSERDMLQSIWRQLASRHNWTLVADEEAFLDQAIGELRQLDPDIPASKLRKAVKRAYGVLLYQGFQARSDAAALELWLAMFRLSLRDGWSEFESYDLAQEAVTRVCEKLADLTSPHNLIYWSTMILRTVWRDYRRGRRGIGIPSENTHTWTDPDEMEAAVEQATITISLVRAIRVALPSRLEQLVVLRMMLFGDQPRAIAHDLGIPFHQARLAKHRALKRLRADEQFLHILHQLTDSVRAVEAIGEQTPLPQAQQRRDRLTRVLGCVQLTRATLNQVLHLRQSLGVAWGANDEELVLIDEEVASHQVILSIQKQVNQHWEAVVTLLPPVVGHITLTLGSETFRVPIEASGSAHIPDIATSLIEAHDGSDLALTVEARL